MTHTSSRPYLHSARFIGSFPQRRTPRYIVAGQDGGQSISIGEKTLFFFSDTLLVASGQYPERTHPSAPLPMPVGAENLFLANCAAISEGSDLPAALSSLKYFHDDEGFPLEILKPDARERFRRMRFWPEHGIFINGKVYFFYLGIQSTDASNIWGFRTIGAGIAEFNPETGDALRFSLRGDYLFWRNPAVDFHFGVYVTLEDGWVYVFGSLRETLYSTARLARVRPEQITSPEHYEYLASTEPTWSRKMAESCSLGPSSGEFSVTWNPYLGQYAMIYIDEYYKRLMLRLADNLWGPYSEPTGLIDVPHLEDSSLVYLGFEHVGFQQQDGRKIFVSYCEPHFASSSLVTLTFDFTRSSTSA